MPARRIVEVKTVSGLIRFARRSGFGFRPANGRRPARVHCWSTVGGRGDLMAIGWHEVA
jgi:hypothetical protein